MCCESCRALFVNLVVVLGPHRPRRLQYSNVGDNRGVACARAVAVLEGAQRPKKSASVALDVRFQVTDCTPSVLRQKCVAERLSDCKIRSRTLGLGVGPWPSGGELSFFLFHFRLPRGPHTPRFFELLFFHQEFLYGFSF